jgi:flagellar biogenesis protein FliO
MMLRPALGLVFIVVAVIAPRARAWAAPVRIDAEERLVRLRIAGAAASGAAVTASGDLIDVPIARAEALRATVEVADPTVKRVEVQGGAGRVRVKVHHSRETTQRLARGTVVRAAGGDLVIEVPRREYAPVGSLSKSTAVVETASAPSSSPPAPAPPPPAPAPSASAPSSSPAPAPSASAPSPAPAATSVVTTAATVAPPPPPATGSSSPPPPSSLPLLAVGAQPSSSSDAIDIASAGGRPTAALFADERPRTSMSVVAVGAVALTALGALFWARRRRRGPAAQPHVVRVLSSQSLNAKAQLVLVAVNDREMLLSVGERGAQLLAEWTPRASGDEAEADAEAEAPALGALDTITPSPARRAEAKPPRAAAKSAAIAGLLRLRRPEAAAADEAEADGTNAAADWRQRFLAAMNAVGR